MTTQIRMPAFSATMESAKLLAWLVAEGETVEKGQVIAEIETDKSIAEIESPFAGTVRKLLVPEGDEDIDVETPLIELDIGDAEVPSPPLQSPVETEAASTHNEGKTESRHPHGSDKPVAAAPAARRAAKDVGINLHDVVGTGPGGRITREDVLNYNRGLNTDQQAASSELSSRRLAIARAMVQAKTSVPHFYTETDVVIDGLLQQKQTALNANPDVRISLTTLFIVAVAKALGDVKEVNTRWNNNRLEHKKSCDIGVAVDVGNGVVVPVIRNADKMDTAQIADNLDKLVALARAGKLKQSYLGDASLTISNLGMFSIDRFFSIVNIPEPLIVGIGRARRAAVVEKDQLLIRSVVTVTLSVDHRVIDGALAGRFANALQKHIESQMPAPSFETEK